MPLMNGQLTDYLHCIICLRPFSEQRKPFTLICSHTCCFSCLETIQYCPYDQTTIKRNLPENEAILGLIEKSSSLPYCYDSGTQNYGSIQFDESMGISHDDIPHYLKCVESIKQITSLLKPQQSPLSRPMQRKLISLLHCQFIEGEGRSRAMRNARSIGERALSELLIKHQDPHTLSANLWAAVRSRGCQFLGPAMQEDVLRLVLLALEDGNALSRKVLVMFVVQRLSPHFPHQASKTAIGHVIQLLYRASCFKLTKRDGDSSLMQLKEEYCSYEALRREHDTQIVSIALEAGLRISPDQWSSLLYGDTEHKSHMQSIIDKLQSPQSFQQSIQELVIALQRTGDPAGLGYLKEHFEKLALIDVVTENHPNLAELAYILESTKVVTTRLVEFVKDHASGMFKNSNRISGANHYYSPMSKIKLSRVKPHHSCVSTPSPSPVQSPIEKTFSQFNIHGDIDHYGRHASSRSTLSPLKPHFSRPFFNSAHRIQQNLSPVPHHPIAMPTTLPPNAKMASSYLIAGQSHYTSRDAIQAKQFALAAIPAIYVDPSANHQSSPTPSTVMSSSDMTSERSNAVSPISFENGSSSQSSSQTCPLPSDDDQFIPFDEHPFVSKYGPISRAMNLINTPTVAHGSASNAQRLCRDFSRKNSTGTQPTSVVFGGRTAFPSLTMMPFQNLVLTTIMTDGSQTVRNQTDNSYSVGNGLSPAVSLS